MSRRHAGFTLIELATTIAILGLLAGMVLPSLKALLEYQRTSAVIGSLTSHMQLARMTAISRNHRAVLCPSANGQHCAADTDWSRGWILFLDPDNNRQPDRSEDLLRVEQEPVSRHLRIFSNVGRQQLRYLPDGSSAGSNLSLTLCNADGLLLGKVIVNNAGRPRSERPTQTTACPS